MKKLHKKILLILLLALYVFITLPISKVTAGILDDAGLINSVFKNPGIGWQETLTPGTPILPESIVYKRSSYSWKLQNPGENVYDWSKVDKDLSAAIAQGKQFSFRIYTMKGESFGGHQVPTWALNKGITILTTGQPDFSNCTYQTEWGKFVEAMRKKYDGNTNIAFIDISGYGNFNEWSWNDQTNVDNNINLDAQARKRLADMFIGGNSTTHQCKDENGNNKTISYSYPGFRSTQLVMPYAGIAASSRYVHNKRSDVGFRFDCLGRAGSANQIINKVGDVIQGTWQKAPVIFEFCGSASTTSALIGESDKLLEYAHGSIVHDNFTGSRSVGDLNRILANIGYKYSIDSFSLSSDLKKININWKNIGNSPSYPKMGQNFELHIYAISSNSGKILKDIMAGAGVVNWMPGKVVSTSADLSDIINLSTDKIQIKTAIINKRTGKAINLPLLNKDTNNRYLVTEFMTTAPTPPPITSTIQGSNIQKTPSPKPVLTQQKIQPKTIVKITANPSPTQIQTAQVKGVSNNSQTQPVAIAQSKPTICSQVSINSLLHLPKIPDNLELQRYGCIELSLSLLSLRLFGKLSISDNKISRIDSFSPLHY